MHRSVVRPSRRVAAIALAAMLPAVLFAPSPAHAWWRGGFFVGIPGPIVVSPPIFAPPPVVYGPPPGYGSYGPPPDSGSYGPPPGFGSYGPPPGSGSYGPQSGSFGPQSFGPPSGYGAPPGGGRSSPPSFAGQPSRTCFAGTITCPLDPQFPRGAGCSCPADGGLAYGRAG